MTEAVLQTAGDYGASEWDESNPTAGKDATKNNIVIIDEI